MNNVLNGIIGNECFVYLDDIVIFSESFESHLPKLRNVLDRLRTNHLFIQPDKSEFLHAQLPYLGFIISKDGIKPNPKKVEAIQKFPEPKNEKGIQRFLGLAGFYRRFIPNYSNIIKPLTNLLRKDIPFEWSSQCQTSFNELKTKLTSTELMLQYPNFEEPFYLYTDASNHAIGAVLQQRDSNNPNSYKPVSFASRTLNKAEVNYSTTEKELLAIVWAVKYFRPYLFGRKFIIRSDHRPLVWLFKVKDPGSRLLRWRLKLEEFDYEIEYIPGTQNTVADCLSRIDAISTYSPMTELPLKECRTIAVFSSPDIIEHNSLITPTMLKNISTGRLSILEDNDRRFIILCYVKSSEHAPFEILEFKSLLESLKQILIRFKKTNIGILDDFDGGVSSESSRLATENLLQEALYPIQPSWLILKKKPANLNSFLQEVHEHPLAGHPGIKRTFNLLKSKGYHWTGMKEDITKYINACHECQLTKTNRQPRKHPILITDTSTAPSEKISLDFLGPYTTTNDGNRQVMSIQDDLTKFIYLKAVPKAETSYVIDILMEYFSLFGIPLKIRTDQGSNFCSNLMKGLTEELGIEKIECTAYHPESNGALERSHGTLKEHIKFYVNSERTDWDKYLPTAVYAYNNAVHSSTGFTPFRLMYGRQSNLPYLNPENEYSFEDYFTTTKNKLAQLHHLAHEKQKKNKETTQAHYNNRNLAKYPFSTGDQVLINSSIIPSSRGLPTFSKPYAGPFKVTKLKYPNVTVDIHGQEKTYHSNYVKPYVLPINFISLFFFTFLFALAFGNKVAPINENNGILFQRLGHAKQHASDWNLFTIFNITQFQDRISSLNDLAIATAHIENKFNLTNYYPLMDQQMTTLENLFSDIKASVEHTRVRRGLINAVSVLQKVLWGTPSAYDAEEWNANIGTLQHNSDLQLKLVQNQFQYVNNTVNGFVTSLQIFQTNFQQVAEHMSILDKQSKVLQATLNETLVRQSTLMLQATFENCYLQTYSELYSLQDAVIEAKRNLLHPTILTPKKLLAQMHTHLLPHDQEYPLPISSESISRYFDISMVHSKVMGNHLIFVLTIPLCYQIQYDLIRLIPFPFADSYPARIFHYIAPQAPYLITTRAVNRYHYMNDLSHCKQLLSELYLCDVPTIQRTLSSNCDLQLLRLQSGKCNVTSMPAIEEIWEPLQENNWAFVLNQRQTITFSCKNQTDRIYLLPNRGILTLEPGCSASSESTDFHAQSVEDSYIAAFIPEVNFTVPKINLPIGFEIQPLHLQHIDLDQFNKFSLQLEEANREILSDIIPIHQHHFNWTMLIFQIILFILILCIIVYIYFWFKRKTLNVLSKSFSYLSPQPAVAPNPEDQEMVMMPLTPASHKRKLSATSFKLPLRKSFRKSIRYTNPSTSSTNPYCA
jgi:hypothetical protein